MRFERLYCACGINVYRKRFSCLKTAKTDARIKTRPRFTTQACKWSQVKNTGLQTISLQRYDKFMIYANFARKIWRYGEKAVILRRQN